MKNENIQILRAWAILLVMVHHLPVLLIEPYVGQYFDTVLRRIHPANGVDLFFVISGYLMGVTFLAKTTTQSVLSQTIRFYRKRFFRLIPAAYFWTFFVLLASLILHEGFLPDAVLIRKSIANLFFVRNFEEYLAPTHLGYYWSLSVEAQFYLLLPLAWFLLGATWFWRGVVFLFGLGLFWRAGGESFWMFRYDGLLLGLLLWRLTSTEDYQIASELLRPLSKSLTMMIFFTLIVGLIFMYKVLPSHHISYFVVALISGGLLFLALVSPFRLAFTKKGSVFLIQIGAMSYSLFLAHIPVWIVVRVLLGRLGVENIWAYIGVGWPLALGVAYLSFLKIEPFLTDRAYP